MSNTQGATGPNSFRSSQGTSHVQSPDFSISNENKPAVQQLATSNKIPNAKNQTSINFKHIPLYDREVKQIKPSTKLMCSDITSEGDIINQTDYKYQRYKMQAHDAIWRYKEEMRILLQIDFRENEDEDSVDVSKNGGGVFLDFIKETGILKPPIRLTINNSEKQLPPETPDDKKFFENLSVNQVNKLTNHLRENFENFYKDNFKDIEYNREANEKKLNLAKEKHNYQEDNRQLILEIPSGYIKAQEKGQDDAYLYAEGLMKDSKAGPIQPQPMPTATSDEAELEEEKGEDDIPSDAGLDEEDSKAGPIQPQPMPTATSDEAELEEEKGEDDTSSSYSDSLKPILGQSPIISEAELGDEPPIDLGTSLENTVVIRGDRETGIDKPELEEEKDKDDILSSILKIADGEGRNAQKIKLQKEVIEELKSDTKFKKRASFEGDEEPAATSTTIYQVEGTWGGGDSSSRNVEEEQQKQSLDEEGQVVGYQQEPNNQEVLSVSHANASIKPIGKKLSETKEKENIETGSRSYMNHPNDRQQVVITTNIDL